MRKPLRDKKILVTAGPTWVPIDCVRVISNISSGATGMIIARHAAKLGAEVTLVLGPVIFESAKRKAQSAKLKILRFRYFDEFKNLLTYELKRKKYDIIIHAAAVSDYKPIKISSGKIRSGEKRLALYLKPTVKIADKMRQLAKDAFLVMFKLETQKPREELIDIAYRAMRRSKADLMVANNIDEICEKRHKAYIVDADRKKIMVKTKEELARELLKRVHKGKRI